MIQLHMNPGAVLCIIEPGSIRRLKEGRSWYVNLPNGSTVAICFTPNLDEFSKAIGMHVAMPSPNERQVFPRVHITAEMVSDALAKCKDLPEIDR